MKRVVAARFVSHLGGSAGFVVGLWGLSAYEFGATASNLALLMVGVSAARLIGSAFGGVLVDRFDPRRLLLVGEIAFVPLALTLTSVTSMAQLTLRAPAAWFVSSVVVTAVTSFPPYLAADERALERANVLVEAAATIAFIVGPLAGALTVRWLNLPAVFLLDAVTSLIAVAIIAPVKVSRRERRRERATAADLVSGFRVAYSVPAVALMMVLGSLTWMSFGTFHAVEPLFFRDVVARPAEVLGYVNAVFGAALTLGVVVLDRSRGRIRLLRSVVALTAAGGAGAVVYACTASIVVVFIGALSWGFVLGVLLPLLRTMTHMHTPPAYIGRVTGAFNAHHSLGELLPLAVAPPLADIVGVQRVMVGTGMALVILSPLAWRRASRIDATNALLVAPLFSSGDSMSS